MAAITGFKFNEGSLLRRTLVHVGTFLLGSVLFIGTTSIVLVSVVRTVVGAPAIAASANTDAPAASAGAPAQRAARTRPVRPTRPAGQVAAPTKDE